MASLKECGSCWASIRSPMIGLPAFDLSFGRAQIRMVGAEPRRTKGGGCTLERRGPKRLNAASNRFSSPKTGSVGTDRFKDGALPGTYWNDSADLGEEVAIAFNTKTEIVTVSCKAGDNLLKVAESSGVMIPTLDFCFQGACCLCEMEVEGGAIEVGFCSDVTGSDLVRSCLCPVPRGRQTLRVNILGEDDVWGAGVL